MSGCFRCCCPCCNSRRTRRYLIDARRSYLKAFILLVFLILHILSCRHSVTALGNDNNGKAFNPQVMLRVKEHLGPFLKIPSLVTGRASRLISIGGFDHDLEAPDRDAVWRHLFMENQLADLYVGLEDGLYLAYGKNRNMSYYREPGNSGYKILRNTSGNGTPVAPDGMKKHFRSCVDDLAGKSRNCILPVGSNYIECIDGCSLVPCPTDSSSSSQSAHCSEISDPFKRQSCAATRKWCRQYAVKTVADSEQGQLGFVPRNGYCINELGRPEQRPGYVMNDAEKPTELGSCYFADGTTLVNRSLEGPYSYCGSSDTEQQQVCNTTFVGAMSGYSSYDPRYRDWYIRTKQHQRSLWSDPYVFYEPKRIGITFSEPIYSILPNHDNDDNYTTNQSAAENNNKERRRHVFKGVLAVDYNLDEIAFFLKDCFSRTDMMVLAVEQDEPNYVVASSHGSSSARTVLKSDPTQLCPVDQLENDTACEYVRTPIRDYNATRNDIVYQRAFEARKKLNFPPLDLVSLKESDVLGSKAYVSQGDIFVEPNGGNLAWHIVVVMPMYRPESDTAISGDVEFAVICTLASIGFTGCLMMLLTMYSKRNERAVIHADWRFTCLFLGGCSALNLSSFALLGDHTKATCMLRMWLFNTLFACAFSPLLVKVWRMYKLLDAATTFRRQSITNVQALLYTVPIIAVQFLLLIIFSFVDPPIPVENLSVSDDVGLQSLTCSQETNAYFIAQIVFDGILVAAGCVLAYKTRNLNPKFGEAKQLAFSMYNIAFTGLIIVLILQMVDLDESSQFVLQAVGIVWGTLFSGLAFVLPRLLEVAESKRASGAISTNTLTTCASQGIAPSSSIYAEQACRPTVSAHSAVRFVMDESDVGFSDGKARCTTELNDQCLGTNNPSNGGSNLADYVPSERFTCSNKTLPSSADRSTSRSESDACEEEL